MATGPLLGMRVVDFTTTIAGPYCARMMADLGAEVIKVETTDGDMMRSRPPLRNGASTSFGQLNAGKQSIVLDLKRPEAQEVIRRLLPTTDFLVENFRPGVMKRFNLDYETLSKRHPALIYCSISGYGQTGPSSGLPAYAPAIHAASGFDMAHIAYQPGRDRPDNCGIYIADIVSGTYAFAGAMAALAQRHVTGRGQHVDVSMLETMLSLLVGEVQTAQFPVAPPGRPMFGPVRTKDGFIMPAVASEKTFQSLCQAAGHPEWITDPRFAAYANRRDNWGVFVDELELWSTTLTTAECQAAFDASGVPASPYRTVREVMADPQLAHREAFAEVQDKGGSFKVLNPPFRMSDAHVRVSGFSASLGEHGRDILESAGYAADEIDQMAATGVIRLD
ncbi:MAG TPA: carnitine dehydratase [Acetobacteraceae bacterium]|jgi:CoA:oxalate CoA-transferase|nr:carnitine dehydratase [Acetobacteraceae bacterium]